MLDTLIKHTSDFTNGLYKIIESKKKGITKEEKPSLDIHTDLELIAAVEEYNICLKNEANADPFFIDAAILATSASKEKINAIIMSRKASQIK